MNRLPRAARILETAIRDRVFPGAVLEVGSGRGPVATLALGRISYAAGAAATAPETIYDLASLTKVLCTTTLVAGHLQAARLRLDDSVAQWSPPWSGSDRRDVTLRHLLDHSSGLPAHRPYFRQAQGRDEFERAIATEPLAYEPGTRSLYSDPGFMLLGFIVERAGSETLERQFDAWTAREVTDAELRFRPPASWLARTAPTEQDPWRCRLLLGEVHDENAAALGGAAGHAGLFGTAGAVGRCARWWMRQARESALHATFLRRTASVPGSSRALGWDTMLPGSSCGTRMSPAAVGHTGFTGTSLWMDPAADLYVVLLTNRVHPSRDGQAMPQVRRALHDAVADDLGLP